MQFANINTGQIVTSLPSVLVLDGRTVTGADITHYAELGWRKVVEVNEPEAGYRVTRYGVEAIDGLTCRLTVAESVNIAEEQAAEAAAAAAAAAQLVLNQKAEAKNLLDGGTLEIQRALRAFAELTLQEINTLRTRASLSTYTWSQFVTALKNKIDAQS